MKERKHGESRRESAQRNLAHDGSEGPKAVTTEELFAPGKKVVVFALPGAFTPTCSAKHVPGFVPKPRR